MKLLFIYISANEFQIWIIFIDISIRWIIHIDLVWLK